MDRFDYYFRQNVTESELDDGFNACEIADRNMITDQGLVGRNSGLVATQTSPTPAVSVDVSAGIAYDQAGQRIETASETVSVALDNAAVSTEVATPGNTKIVSVFVEFQRALSDPRIDGNSDTVFYNRAEDYAFFVKQGAESAGTPTPPALESGRILLCDITRSFGQTQILNADIGTSRREDLIKIAAKTATPAISEGTIEEAIDAVVDVIDDLATSELPPDVQLFDATDTWNKPTGALWHQILILGGGGGGGGIDSGGSRGGGGGGASGSLKIITVPAAELEATLAIVVGAAGVGGYSVTSYNGGKGGTSSVGGYPGTYVVAEGGDGGGGSTTTTAGAGAAVNGNYGAFEAAGGDGKDTGDSSGGDNGDPGYSGSPGNGGSGFNNAGEGGRGYGAGGGGAASTNISSGSGGGGGGGYGSTAYAEDGNTGDGANGGAGGAGVVIVTTWVQPTL